MALRDQLSTMVDESFKDVFNRIKDIDDNSQGDAVRSAASIGLAFLAVMSKNDRRTLAALQKGGQHGDVAALILNHWQDAATIAAEAAVTGYRTYSKAAAGRVGAAS